MTAQEAHTHSLWIGSIENNFNIIYNAQQSPKEGPWSISFIIIAVKDKQP